MRILVTNDDGIRACGLAALCGVLVELGHQVTVVAPAGNQSGRSQAISMQAPIRARRVSLLTGLVGAYAVEGTPADCVRAMEGFLPGAPDLVMSGINHGANLGPDVFRSGTVGAAREAALSGIPAVSLSTLSDVPSASLLRYHVPEVAYLAVASPGLVINVNFPVVPNLIRVIVPAATSGYRDESTVRETGDGRYEILMRRTLLPDDTTLTDIRAALMGYVTVSRLPVRETPIPLGPDLPLVPRLGHRDAGGRYTPRMASTTTTMAASRRASPPATSP
jgi:5'/3'-nucleotidase SurE